MAAYKTFEPKPYAKIVAGITGDATKKFTIDGTNANEDNADNAVAQINKITGIFGVTVNTNGIQQIITKDGVDV